MFLFSVTTEQLQDTAFGKERIGAVNSTSILGRSKDCPRINTNACSALCSASLVQNSIGLWDRVNLIVLAENPQYQHDYMIGRVKGEV